MILYFFVGPRPISNFQKCQSVCLNFNFYFTIGKYYCVYHVLIIVINLRKFFIELIYLGMVSFFVFWGTLLFHIWPPSLYMSEDLMFWKNIFANKSTNVIWILHLFLKYSISYRFLNCECILSNNNKNWPLKSWINVFCTLNFEELIVLM